MNIASYSIKNFITIISIASLFCIFGIISFNSIPTQLVPNVEKPEITVQTIWKGASPEEIESEIVKPQEDQLKTLEGLKSIESTSIEGKGEITLNLIEGRNIDSAIIQTSNLLNQVKQIPFDSDKPTIKSVSSDTSPIAWFILKSKNSNIYEYKDFTENTIKTRFERVQGVGRANIYGGRSKEVEINIDSNQLALMKISLLELRDIISNNNIDITSGAIEEGKRKYTARTTSEFQSLDDIKNLIIRKDGNNYIRLKNISEVKLGYEDKNYVVRHLGTESIAISVVKETGANTINVVENLLEEVDALNDEILVQKGLVLTNVYADTFYIESSIRFVKQNLLYGAILSIIILLFFLKSYRTTLIIAIAIPTSLISSFIIFNILDRTINLISLAGMSFAVGMVVDNSLVVLENIYSKIESGIQDLEKCCIDGTMEVSGAVLASSLTTIVVFVPIFFLSNEIGQLFQDIAIAISVSIFFSLIISLTLIPGISSRILRKRDNINENSSVFRNLNKFFDSKAKKIRNNIIFILRKILRTKKGTTLSFIYILFISILLTFFLFPKTEYLPEGNRNLIISILIPPQGYNIEKIEDIGITTEKKLQKYWEDKNSSNSGIKNFFFVARPKSVFMGAVAENPNRIKDFINIMKKSISGHPGFISITNQSSLFSRAVGERRAIEIDIQGESYDSIIYISRILFSKLSSQYKDFQIRPKPSLSNSNPEIKILPKQINMNTVGLESSQLGLIINTIIDGSIVGEYTFEGEEIDIRLTSNKPNNISTGAINNQFIFHKGNIFPVSHIAKVDIIDSPQQINHFERQRTIKLQITPDEKTNIEDAILQIKKSIYTEKLSNEASRLGVTYKITGIAGKLREAKSSLSKNFIYALIISYFLLSSLFQSFLYPLIVLTVVPLSSLGGILGLRLLNIFTYQPLNMLTMLGFLILLGIVVNNSILIVYQSLKYFRSGSESIRESAIKAVKERIRPIFMTTLTTTFGLLPLALLPGSGSELYRGLGVVILSGLLISTFFTLILTPISFIMISRTKNQE